MYAFIRVPCDTIAPRYCMKTPGGIRASKSGDCNPVTICTLQQIALGRQNQERWTGRGARMEAKTHSELVGEQKGERPLGRNVDVLLTVHLSIILVINQLNAQNLVLM